MNLVVLAGNLTRDVELRYTPGGAPVGQFGLATNKKWKDKEGQMHDEACFVEVVVWNKQAENAAEYLGKGSPVLIQGSLKLDQWADKQSGEQRSKLKVVAQYIQYLSSGQQSGQKKQQPRQQQSSRVDDLPADGPPDDNCPF
jgi:single-strand DNA-binding protein